MLFPIEIFSYIAIVKISEIFIQIMVELLFNSLHLHN